MAGRAHAGIIDAEKQRMLASLDKSESDLQNAIKWQNEELANSIFVKDDEAVSYVTAEAQMGTPLMWDVFEKKLLTLPCGPQMVFKELSLRPFRCLFMKKPDGTLDKISPYGRCLLPEFSTMILHAKEVRDFSYRHYDRADMPEMVLDKSKGRLGTFVPKDPSAPKPGWKKVYEFWGENFEDPQARGFRTVLARLVPKYCTPQDIEKVFGASNKRSWAVQMGKQDLPYRF